MTTAPIADPTSLGERRASLTLPALDSMRAIAAIAVVATHASFWGGAYAHRGYGTALARLDIGVAIFFVLSAFLLSRPWFEQHERQASPPPLAGYLWRRLIRVFPVYLIAAVAALTLLPGNKEASIATVIRTLTLTNLYVDDKLPSGLSQMWSLATEVAFYVALPFILWLVLSRRRRRTPARSRLGIVVSSLLAINVLWIVATAAWVDMDAALAGIWLPGFLTWFAVGLVISASAIHLHAGTGAAGSKTVATALRRMGRAPGTCWVMALALFAVAATPVAGSASLVAPVAGEAVTKNLLYAASAGLLILPCVFADPQGPFIRVMSNSVLRHLGHISYGIFCVHLVILELVARWRDITLFEGRTLELFTITLALSIVVSEILYRLVELPSTRWKRFFDGRPSSTRASSTPSPANTTS